MYWYVSLAGTEPTYRTTGLPDYLLPDLNFRREPKTPNYRPGLVIVQFVGPTLPLVPIDMLVRAD